MQQDLPSDVQACIRRNLPTRSINAQKNSTNALTDITEALRAPIRSSTRISDFRDVLAAKLLDVEQIVLQEVARLDDAALQLRSEKDVLMRDLAEARGLFPSRSLLDGKSDMNAVQQGEACASKSSSRMPSNQSAKLEIMKSEPMFPNPAKSGTSKSPDRRLDLLRQARRQERLHSTYSHGSTRSITAKSETNFRRSVTSAMLTRANPRSATASISPGSRNVKSEIDSMKHSKSENENKVPPETAERYSFHDEALSESKHVAQSPPSGMSLAAAAVAAARFAERQSASGEPDAEGPHRTTSDGNILPASERRTDSESEASPTRVKSESDISLVSPRSIEGESEADGPRDCFSPEDSSSDFSGDMRTRKGFSTSLARNLQIEAEPPAMGAASIDVAVKSESDAVQPIPSDVSKKRARLSDWRRHSEPLALSTLDKSMSGVSTCATGKTQESMVSTFQSGSSKFPKRRPSLSSSGSSKIPKRRPSLCSKASKRSEDGEAMIFELQSHWLGKMLESPVSQKQLKRNSSRGSVNSARVGWVETDFQNQNSSISVLSPPQATCDQSILRYCMIPPTSWVRVTWELWGLLMIGYDFVFLPLQIFSLQDSTFTVTMEWIQRIFWTISIPFSFFVGYVLKDGKVELRPSKVRRHYCKTWFPFDMAVVVSDWAEVILKTLEFLGAMRLVKTVRVSRILRMIRVFRTIKLPKVMENLDIRIFSEKTVILLGIGKIFFLFMCLGHLIACTWYGVGRYGSQDAGWIVYYGYLDDHFSYRYMTSLHWALTQFIGSMDVMPRNLAERTFANVMLLCSFVITAWFVSSITAQITRLQIIAGGRDGQFAVLRQFLWHHKVTTKLAMRVVRSAQQALDQQALNTSEKDVDLLSYVSEPLRAEIHYEMYYSVLCVHPFFRYCDDLNRHLVRDVCHSSIEVIFVDDGDCLFTAGEMPTNPQMYFIVGGLLGYSWEDASMPVLESMWACEATLWTEWVHLGTLQAYYSVRIQAIDADMFRQVLNKGQREAVIAANYAVRFVEYMNKDWDAVLDVNMDLDHERWMSEVVAEVCARADALSFDASVRRLSTGTRRPSLGIGPPKRPSLTDQQKASHAVLDFSSIAPEGA